MFTFFFFFWLMLICKLCNAFLFLKLRIFLFLMHKMFTYNYCKFVYTITKLYSVNTDDMKINKSYVFVWVIFTYLMYW